MDNLLRMGTYPRHNHLASSFFSDIFHLFKKKIVYPLQENCYLAFHGKKYSGDERLIDASEILDLDLLEELDVIQPDFLVFKDNPFIQSKSTFKTAGIPDLVVEIWSKSNDRLEKEMKFRIYSSSDLCEHWYLTQDSNDVECYIGKKKLPNQTISAKLITRSGLEFDLTHLAL